MFDKNTILCGSSAYEQMFYLNPDFETLPESVRNELKILCVLFTEEVGGILRLEFDEKGELLLTTEAREEDLTYDEIGSVLKIKQIQKEKKELLESLEMFYKVFFLGEDIEEDRHADRD